MKEKAAPPSGDFGKRPTDLRKGVIGIDHHAGHREPSIANVQSIALRRVHESALHIVRRARFGLPFGGYPEYCTNERHVANIALPTRWALWQPTALTVLRYIRSQSPAPESRPPPDARRSYNQVYVACARTSW